MDCLPWPTVNAPGVPPASPPYRSPRPSRSTCQLPAEAGDAPVALVLPGTGRRTDRAGSLKPWQHRSWIFIRDPDFRAKAQQVLDLYARTFEGILLGPDEYVLSSDEKTSIQARCRCHPTLDPGQARAMRVSHEYGRGGALAGCGVAASGRPVCGSRRPSGVPE